tara:strand:- start:40 stop:237 length:198 start_codon:yes stop_codon:yes gene_type:complete
MDRVERMPPPYMKHNAVVVPMDDFKIILRQLWKSRATEPIIGELYEKYTTLTTFNEPVDQSPCDI